MSLQDIYMRSEGAEPHKQQIPLTQPLEEGGFVWLCFQMINNQICDLNN